MNKWICIAGGLAMSCSQLSYAASAAYPAQVNAEVLALQVGQTPIQDEHARMVSAMEAAQVRGKVLPYVLGMAAVDIALASFFWGIYVPFYADKEPAH